MSIRRQAPFALGLALATVGAVLIVVLARQGQAALNQLPVRNASAPDDALSVCTVVGWVLLAVGLLLITPATWFRWLEKPASAH